MGPAIPDDLNQDLEAVAQRCSAKKGAAKNFAKFTGKHLCQSLFFDKVTGLRQAMQSICHMERSFHCETWERLKNPTLVGQLFKWWSI